MKNLQVIFILTLMSITAFGQTGAVTNAILYHQEGRLDKAKEQIDLAIGNDKTKVQAKTWYYRGTVYLDLFKSEKPEFIPLNNGSAKAAFESFNKAKELEGGKGEYAKLSEPKLEELWTLVVNKGISLYQSNKQEEAIGYYEIGQQIKPKDTVSYLYASYAADDLKRYDLVKNYNNKLMEIGYKSPDFYRSMISIAYNVDKDPNKALEITTKALADYPDDHNLRIEQSKLYVETGKAKEAVANLQMLVQKNPGDVDLLNNLAYLYDKSGDTEKALEYYNKSLSSQPTNLFANFNAAIIYYDRGNDLKKKINLMKLDEYQKVGKQKEAELKEIYTKSLGYAEAAYKEADPNENRDITTLIKELNKNLNKKDNFESLHK